MHCMLEYMVKEIHCCITLTPYFVTSNIHFDAEPENVKYSICRSYYMTYPDTKLYIENKTENECAMLGSKYNSIIIYKIRHPYI